MPQIKKWAQFWPLPLTERGGGMCPRKKRQDEVTVGHTNKKKIFFGFVFYFFSERGWSVNAKKIFLNFTPTPPPWGGVKVEKFRFLGFTKYLKVLQHRVIAR